jgi:type IV pilus assembly protein PilO
MQLSLSKLPWQAQIGAFVVIAIGAAAGYYYEIEMPIVADMATKRTQLVALRRDITKGLTTAKKLPEFRAGVTDLENRLANLRAILPEEKDAADLLRRMQTVAVQSNLDIRSFKPNPTVTKELHAEWPINLELQGSYHNLAQFFDRVGKFTRIVNITGVDIKNRERPDPNMTITAKCTATTFVLLDPEAAKAAGRGGRGRRGGPPPPPPARGKA